MRFSLYPFKRLGDCLAPGRRSTSTYGQQEGSQEGKKEPVEGCPQYPEHVLDRLYLVIDTHKDADPDLSNTARLFRRGPAQIAKKLGEEAVEAVIQGVRGNGSKLVGESADLLYHLLTLWAATNVKPNAVWAELLRREGLSASKKTSK